MLRDNEPAGFSELLPRSCHLLELPAVFGRAALSELSALRGVPQIFLYFFHAHSPEYLSQNAQGGVLFLDPIDPLRSGPVKAASDRGSKSRPLQAAPYRGGWMGADG